MNALVIGQGGREHALVKALNESPRVDAVYVMPGNDGMSSWATVIAKPATPENVLAQVAAHKIELVVIGPEVNLVDGLADHLREAGVKVVGPSRAGARLEASKVFSKEFMQEFGVPTAHSIVVKTVGETLDGAKDFTPPYVLKADGLAAGKGVFICKDLKELERDARSIFEERTLGDAGSSALLEQFSRGKELSVLILTNAEEYRALPFCRDHKRLGEKDTGPNTGGMGVVGPIEISDSLWKLIEDEVISPSLEGLRSREMLYRGVLYIGVMLTEEGPSVLEYNVRFGDPEAQMLLPMLDGDWAEVFAALADGQLIDMKWKSQSVTCLVLAAEGYPENPVKGTAITGDVHYSGPEGYLLHAGTRAAGSSGASNAVRFVTNGGRVMNAVGIGRDLVESRERAYKVAENAQWSGRQMRRDIGL